MNVMSSDGVLVIGAHAFDAEVMAGAACATYAMQGRRVVLVHLSQGELGHATMEPRSYASQKRAEAEDAARLLGAEALFFDYPDAGVPDSDGLAIRVAHVIRAVRPITIIGHWKGTWHKDHLAAHRAMVQGVFYAALPTFDASLPAHAPHEVLFGENWEDDDGFRPDVYVDTTLGYPAWLNAINAYQLGRGELGGFHYRDYYTSLSRLRGCLAGSEHAQAFMRIDQSVLVGLGQFAVDSANVR